jgi:DNA-binding response OmpR family regulator
VNDRSETAILIVEDEGLIALEMMEFLAREGYRVLEPVPTGEEAVDRCGDYPRPGLILMDVHLAGKIDGIEATRRIRERYPIPVIILTACDDGITGTRMRDLAPEGYLVKPASCREIIAAISLVLQSVSRKGSEKTGEGYTGVLREQPDQ